MACASGLIGLSGKRRLCRTGARRRVNSAPPGTCRGSPDGSIGLPRNISWVSSIGNNVAMASTISVWFQAAVQADGHDARWARDSASSMSAEPVAPSRIVIIMGKNDHVRAAAMFVESKQEINRQIDPARNRQGRAHRRASCRRLSGTGIQDLLARACGNSFQWRGYGSRPRKQSVGIRVISP